MLTHVLFSVDVHVIGYSVILLARRFRSPCRRYIKERVSLGKSKTGFLNPNLRRILRFSTKQNNGESKEPNS